MSREECFISSTRRASRSTSKCVSPLPSWRRTRRLRDLAEDTVDVPATEKDSINFYSILSYKIVNVVALIRKHPHTDHQFITADSYLCVSPVRFRINRSAATSFFSEMKSQISSTSANADGASVNLAIRGHFPFRALPLLITASASEAAE